MLYTNEQGRYTRSRRSCRAGTRYPPNLPGFEKYAGLTRPAHIHFRVMESLRIPLTTQLYFKGDPYIANDPFAGHKSTLVVDLKPDGQVRRGIFDIVLSRGV